MNPFVPIVIWMRAVFAIDRAGPGVFARRLVEMGVNDDRAHALLQGRLPPHLSMRSIREVVSRNPLPQSCGLAVGQSTTRVSLTTHRIRFLAGRARSARGFALSQVEGRAEWRKCDRTVSRAEHGR